MLKYQISDRLYKLNSSKTSKETQQAALSLADFININRWEIEKALEVHEKLFELKELLK